MMSLLSPSLQAFLAVARLGRVHEAARKLHISQTGVTQRVRTLESTLGTTLFLRSRKGMALTPDGISLLRYCEQAESIEGEFLGRLGGETGSGTQRISILGPTSIMRSRIVPSCAKALSQFSNLRLTFQISDDSLPGSALKTGKTDLEIMDPLQVSDEFESRLLKPEKYLLVAPKKWQGRKVEVIVREEVIIDFDSSDNMSFRYLEFAGFDALSAPERHFVNNTEALASLIRDGHGYGVLTQEFANEYLQRNDLILLNKGKFMEHRLALAWYRRPTMPTWFEKILNVIK
jgi:LysR family transcriptional regulator, chromosome initiation inhibitor